MGVFFIPPPEGEADREAVEGYFPLATQLEQTTLRQASPATSPSGEGFR